MIPCTSPRHIWLLLMASSCLASRFVMVGGILQTEALEVHLSDAAPSRSTYTILTSQAFFGSLPSMDPTSNPRMSLSKAPEDNLLLCQNHTGGSEITDSSTTTQYGGTMMLVPRGTCSFETKAWHAQQLGAKGILIYGNLASRYDLNTTNKTEDYEYSILDITYPLELYDFDCTNGQAHIPSAMLSLDPLPYNAQQNDPLLSGESSENLCMRSATDNLESCPSKACLLTGKSSTTDGQATMEACCAWDLHIWLYQDNNFDELLMERVVIPAAYLSMQQANQLLQDMEENEVVLVTLYTRWRPQYNPAILLIWALGVSVAALAAYLSAGDYHDYIRRVLRRQERHRQGIDTTTSSRTKVNDGVERSASSARAPPEDMELTAAHALGFIIMASSSLLVLFYFKIYGIVKVFYSMGCSKAVSQVVVDPFLKRLMKKFRVRNQIIWRTNTEDFGDISLRDIMAHVIGFTLGLSWLIIAFMARDPGSITFFWIMQDIFGTCMCVMFLQVIKLNSIRVAAILLVVAFFYDIFFVFVTPLLFQGKSVMITVATSGGPPTADPLWCEKYPNDANCQGGNPLPMLLTIPRLFDFEGGSSLLGLGDIVLPGLLLSFAARFDAAKRMMGVMGGGSGSLTSYHCQERRYCCSCGLCSGGYFPPMVAAYAVGLLMANMAVQIMHMGQPALLYLVPCCLGTMVYMGWRRNELSELWDISKVIRSADNTLYGDYYSSGPSTMATSHDRHAPLPQDDDEPGIAVQTVPSALDDTGSAPFLPENDP